MLASIHAVATIIAVTNGGRCSEIPYDKLTAQVQYITDFSEVMIDKMCLPQHKCNHSAPKYVF